MKWRTTPEQEKTSHVQVLTRFTLYYQTILITP